MTVTDHDAYQQLAAAYAKLQADRDLLKAEYADLQADRDLLKVERNVFHSEMLHAHRSIDALRRKLRLRGGVFEPGAIDEIERNLADTGRTLDTMIGLYRAGAATATDVHALAELSDIVDEMGQRDLVGLLITAVRRLAAQPRDRPKYWRPPTSGDA